MEEKGKEKRNERKETWKHRQQKAYYIMTRLPTLHLSSAGRTIALYLQKEKFLRSWVKIPLDEPNEVEVSSYYLEFDGIRTNHIYRKVVEVTDDSRENYQCLSYIASLESMRRLFLVRAVKDGRYVVRTLRI